MDEKSLQQKEMELRIKENELNARESDLNNRETRAQLGLDLTINTQEFLRRAIEVGANSIQKLEVDGSKRMTMVSHLEDLIDTAAIKLKKELDKLGK